MSYPKNVPEEEQEECTLENVPDKMIKEAMSTLEYKECPECGTRQWFNYTPGINTFECCKECGIKIRLWLD